MPPQLLPPSSTMKINKLCHFLVRSGNLLLRELSDFVYPRICGGCARRLSHHERGICLGCKLALQPFIYEESLLHLRFTSFFVPISAVKAGFIFSRDSIARHIVHSIKYAHNKDAGLELGKLLARKTLISNADFDLIVPVPIHRSKFADRRYNQATIIAQGLSEETGIPVQEHALRRVEYPMSQTRRNRVARMQAMQGAFRKGRDFPQVPKRILLIDDVLTTGATLAEAAKVLMLSHPSSVTILAATVDV